MTTARAVLKFAARYAWASIQLLCLGGVVLALFPIRMIYHKMGGTGKFPYYYLDKWVGFP